jgi:plasmid maintenance system antidote protein VapI
MTVRRGTKVHPANFPLILKLKDQIGFTYDDLSDLLEVTPSRIQQIVLQERRKVTAHVDDSASRYAE